MNRNLKYALAVAAVAGGAVLVAGAQTPRPVPGSAPATTPPPMATATPATPVTPPAAPAPAPSPAVSPERFEPTDKVRADFDVSFPIDI